MLMNPVLPNDAQNLAHKDAIFFSLHKFMGGVQTPGIILLFYFLSFLVIYSYSPVGVLIVKKDLIRNTTPSESGGGTVFFVKRDNHRYLKVT